MAKASGFWKSLSFTGNTRTTTSSGPGRITKSTSTRTTGSGSTRTVMSGPINGVKKSRKAR